VRGSCVSIVCALIAVNQSDTDYHESTGCFMFQAHVFPFAYWSGFVQSFWLRDALTEVDSTCEKITFICTPSSEQHQSRRAQKKNTIENALLLSEEKPAFRIQGVGSYGTTYVRGSPALFYPMAVIKIIIILDGLFN
jgi:hypothetical protein